LRGELEECLAVAISIGEAGPGILTAGSCGDEERKRGRVESSSSGGNSKSSWLKWTSSPTWWRRACQWKK
jgi:hypothetical protein